MSTPYDAFEFRISLGYADGAALTVRVHAPTREAAWARVQQMHPRAVPLEGAAAGAGPRKAANRAEHHTFAQSP